MTENARLNDITNPRPVFSGHETFPMRYGWLKKVFDACETLEKQGKTSIKGFLSSDEAMVVLGVGKNMVAAMRYWASYSGLLDTTEDKELKINPVARKLFADKDPWLENYATLWYIHWNLVCGKRNNNDCLFTYYWFFNHYNFSTFDKEVLSKQIQEFLKDKWGVPFDKLPASLTLNRDIDCFISIYSAKPRKGKSDEEGIESPLVELGLINPITRRDVFQINRGIKPSLSIHTFLFGLIMFWKEYSPNAKTMSFESMCYQPQSPGRVFLINEDAVSEYMHNISKITKGLLEYSETAGMKEIILKHNIDFEKTAYEFFWGNYQ